jgi:hypothetical protein
MFISCRGSGPVGYRVDGRRWPEVRRVTRTDLWCFSGDATRERKDSLTATVSPRRREDPLRLHGWSRSCAGDAENGIPRDYVDVRVPRVAKAAYGRSAAGWDAADSAVFDDWNELNRLIVDSFGLIARKRIAALFDEDAS